MVLHGFMVILYDGGLIFFCGSGSGHTLVDFMVDLMAFCRVTHGGCGDHLECSGNGRQHRCGFREHRLGRHGSGSLAENPGDFLGVSSGRHTKNIKKLWEITINYGKSPCY